MSRRVMLICFPSIAPMQCEKFQRLSRPSATRFHSSVVLRVCKNKIELKKFPHCRRCLVCLWSRSSRNCLCQKHQHMQLKRKVRTAKVEVRMGRAVRKGNAKNHIQTVTDQVMKKAPEELSKEGNNSYSSFCSDVANNLTTMESKQAVIAKKIIHDTVTWGSLGMLPESWVKDNPLLK